MCFRVGGGGVEFATRSTQMFLSQARQEADFFCEIIPNEVF